MAGGYLRERKLVDSSTPPPPTAAAVRPLSLRPIPREEPNPSVDGLASPEPNGSSNKAVLARPFDDDTPVITIGEPVEISGLEEDEAGEAESTLAAAAAAGATIPSPPPEVEMAPPRRPAPPSTAAFAVSLREPPVPHVDRALPPVLIHADLVQRVIAGGDDADDALGEILEVGEAALPAVFSQFPGPLSVSRSQIEFGHAPPAECGPVLRIVAALRRLALPFLTARSADSDPDVRFFATHLLGELHYREVAVTIVPRLLDEDRAVRRVGIRSARSLASDPEVSVPLREELLRIAQSPDHSDARRVATIGFIYELQLYLAIPRLIRLLEGTAKPVSSAVHDVLCAFAGEDRGTTVAAWLEWWETRARTNVPFFRREAAGKTNG
jgi:hypothetical protein